MSLNPNPVLYEEEERGEIEHELLDGDGDGSDENDDVEPFTAREVFDLIR